jgi:glycosyl transferase family 2
MKLFTTIYDDARLLGHLLAHYASAGVTEFYVATVQAFFDDVLQFKSRYDLYAFDDLGVDDEYPFGVNAVVRMRDQYQASDEWAIVVDLDEFIEFPTPLEILVTEADHEGANLIRGILYDRFTIDGQPRDFGFETDLAALYPIRARFCRDVMHGAYHKGVIVKGYLNPAGAFHDWEGQKVYSRLLDISHFKWTGRILQRIKSDLQITRTNAQWEHCSVEYRRALDHYNTYGRFAWDRFGGEVAPGQREVAASYLALRANEADNGDEARRQGLVVYLPQAMLRSPYEAEAAPQYLEFRGDDLFLHPPVAGLTRIKVADLPAAANSAALNYRVSLDQKSAGAVCFRARVSDGTRAVLHEIVAAPGEAHDCRLLLDAFNGSMSIEFTTSMSGAHSNNFAWATFHAPRIEYASGRLRAATETRPIGTAAGVTVVLTSCGRQDLLQRTLDSFLVYNTFPIRELIIVEDGDGVVNQHLARKYRDYPFTWLATDRRLGQVAAIDMAYAKVRTDLVFHCEDDWEFVRPGFVEKSVAVLNQDNHIVQVHLRALDDTQGQPVSDDAFVAEGIPYRRLVFDYDAGEWGVWHGFSWNPGLRRRRDYDLLGSFRSLDPLGTKPAWQVERDAAAFYRDKGFSAAILADNNGRGYVRHLGEARHVAEIASVSRHSTSSS